MTDPDMNQWRATVFAAIPQMLEYSKAYHAQKNEGQVGLFDTDQTDAPQQDYGDAVFRKSCFQCGAMFTGKGRYCRTHEGYNARHK